MLSIKTAIGLIAPLSLTNFVIDNNDITDFYNILAKINQLLENEGLDIELVDDEQVHDGYIVLSVRSTTEDDH